MAIGPTPTIETKTMIESSLAPITLLDPDPPSNLDLPIALRKGTHSTCNPSSHYVALSYHCLSPSLYICLSFMSFVSYPHATSEALSHPKWRQAMSDKMCALQSNVTCHLGPLLPWENPSWMSWVIQP